MNAKKLFYVSPAVLAGFTVAAALFGATLAQAATLPGITTAIQDGGNVTITTAPIGAGVHDEVTVASSSEVTPTGTVNFNLYTNTVCSGTPIVQSGVALVNGVAQSSTTTVPGTGLSYLVSYNGDSNNVAATGTCEALLATAPSPSITTTLSTTTAVLSSTFVSDSATLSSVTANAGGTVAYSVYSDNECTVLSQPAGTVGVTNGVVPNSTSVFLTTGNYWWQAVYSGDANNAAATSTCGSEVVTVLATSSSPGAGTIGGIVYNDQNQNDVKDASEPGLPGWTVWLHQGAGKYNAPIVATALTDGTGHYSFGSLGLGIYFVEEKEQIGWNQTSGDTEVTLTSGSPGATVDFANVMKGRDGMGDHGRDHGMASSTDQDHNHGNDIASSTDKGHGHDHGTTSPTDTWVPPVTDGGHGPSGKDTGDSSKHDNGGSSGWGGGGRGRGNH